MCGGWRQSRGAASSTGRRRLVSLTFEHPGGGAVRVRLQQVHRDEPDLPGVRTGIHMGEVSERLAPTATSRIARRSLAVDLPPDLRLARPDRC